MSELVTVTLKMPIELRERLKAQAAAEGSSVSALLIAGVEGMPAFGATGDTAALEAALVRVADLTADRDRWRALAKAAMPIATTKPVKRQPEARQRACQPLRRCTGHDRMA